MTKISADRLRELVRYEPETGLFFWRIRAARHIKIGDRAGCKCAGPYIGIGVDGTTYLAHRLAWLYMTGAWPPLELDHRDLNPSNNAWTNLREATRAQNNQNRRLRKDSASGKKGVGRIGAKWRAVIRLEGKQRHLGMYESAEGAAAAYNAAAAAHFGEFAHGG